MAVSIDRVEREFILVSAAQTKTEARLLAAGRSLKCRIATAGEESLSFSTSGNAPRFSPRELVSVCFDFRGQAVAFDAPFLRASSNGLVLGLPSSMYRSLSRRWARVSPPKELTVDFLLPDAQLRLDCPQSDEYAEVELPELREGLASSDLASLVDSFKAKAKELADEGRVVMYKEDRGPADLAEDLAAKTGRVLYLPSTLGAPPLADPYPSGRIVTKEMADDFEGAAAVAQGSKLSAYLRGRAVAGIGSALWCPVVFYRYTVGMVLMTGGPNRPLDYGAVDLAWEFSRLLAWFLKRHGYFTSFESAGSAPRRGGIIDASPSGLLADLPVGGPSLEPGSVVSLRLGLKDRGIVCSGKIARRYSEGGMNFCGIAFLDLAAQDRAFLERELYGAEEEDTGRQGV